MTIHALFVAITDYPDGVSDLPGCTNDLHAIRAFFADYASVNGATFVPTVLHNAEATRPGVIKAFEEFAAAGQDDVCVFYFSGHGSQVPAPREFWDQEPDRKCEAMVLADYGQPSGGFLVDKELSYLLATHTKNAGQVLVLVDSCHSGTITRMHDATPRTTALNIMNLAFADFHGHQEYKPEEGFFRPPVRPHFTFAACRPEQVAMEMPIRGVRHGLFTHYLIEVMSTTNLSEVSYRGLADRVRVRVKNHYPKQDVFVEASTGLSLDTAFFNGKLPQGRNQLLHFDRTAGWFFEQGEVAGIRVRDTGTVLDGEEDRAFTVRRTEAGRSFVVPQDWMDEAKAPYPIVQLAKQADPLPIFVFGEGMSFYEKTIKRYIDKEDNLRLAKQAAEARYHVKILPDYGLSLTLPKEERPLFETTKKWAEAIPDFIQKLAKIATYESILAMAPSTNALDLDRIVDIKLEQVFVDDYGDVVRTAEMDTDGCAVFAYQKVPDYEELEAPNLRLSVKVNEVYDGDLYVGMLFLDEAFGISNQFLKVEKISARDAALRTRTVSDGNSASYVVLTFSDELQSWGLTEITNYLKVVVSETPLQLETYEQKGLTQQVRIEKGGGMRGAAAKLPRRRRRRDRWGVKNIPITIYRPQITSTGTTATPDVISITSQPEGFSSEMMIMDASLSVTRSLASNTPTCPTKGLLLEPVSLMGSRTTAAAETPLDMVQLMDVQNAAAVTAATPLRMRAGNAATEGAMVLAFDEESRRYYPVGFPDPETGELVVQSLPEETPEEYTRSLGGSVK
ncbi:MAG: caspase family protein, partial [Bacteroidota bacterium]